MTHDFLNKKIVLGVCGGIAAYKSAYLIRTLTRLGAAVQVVMTQSAEAFITPMTLQALSGLPVRSALFDPEAERAMGHIELARWADYVIIAPASANMIATLAHGLAHDLLSTVCLATAAPLLICPAMNRRMWLHPATVANCTLLRSRGVVLVGPEEGEQACGDEGLGRMCEVEAIVTALRLQEVPPVLQGQTVLITAGPTQEPIDPVRYITNRSSGKMGYALAAAAERAGANVLLISGPTRVSPPLGVNIIQVHSAIEMHDAVIENLKPGVIFIGAAAVADYRVVSPAPHKIKKQQQQTVTLDLIQNPDILSEVVASGKAALTIGFAAETTHVLSYAEEKWQRKGLDILVANQVGDGIGFDADCNEVTVLIRQETIHLPLMHKTRLAGQLIAIFATNLQNSAPTG